MTQTRPQLWRLLLGALVLLAPLRAGAAPKEKEEKIPVMLGAWKGPSASTFKGALKRGLGKECVVVPKKKARVVIEGVVEEKGKGVTVNVIVKQPKSGEIVEQKEFPFARPTASKAQSDKMGKAIAAIARRTPAEPAE